jgi:hypothetical protein
MLSLDVTSRTWWVGLPALAGAGAAFAVPGSASGLATGASILALAALALLAGHAWALFVMVTSQVTLVGRLGPVVSDPSSDRIAISVLVVVVLSSVPAVWLTLRVARRLLAGRRAKLTA